MGPVRAEHDHGRSVDRRSGRRIDWGSMVTGRLFLGSLAAGPGRREQLVGHRGTGR